MNRDALRAYPLDRRLENGQSAVLMDLAPIFRELLTQLALMRDPVSEKALLSIFQAAILRVNAFANEIETVEREAILEIVYEVGEIAGLQAASRFAEEWRGDW
jgi:hypothetical protein